MTNSSYTHFAAVTLIGIFLTGPACTTPNPRTHTRASAGTRTITIIGHRGASGYRPEHTLASYELAIEQGADFVEPDLVMTKDNVLIARHENEISGTTDVAEKFPGRKRTKMIDGTSVAGWFTEDFTLREIKTLRAKERLASRDQSRNGMYPVPTFAEIIELVQRKSRDTGRVIGIYPETKHPSYFTSIRKPLEPALAKELARVGWSKETAPVIIQSFELESLRRLKSLVANRLVFLYDEPSQIPFDERAGGHPKTYGDYTKPSELAILGTFLYGIGPAKGYILPPSPTGEPGAPTTLIDDAHRAGLVVHPYTFRSDPPFLAAAYSGDPTREYEQFFELGVDGVFSDFPEHAVKARDT